MTAHLRHGWARFQRRLDTAVLLAAIALVPVTVLELNGFDHRVVQAVAWAVFVVFLADAIVAARQSFGRRRPVRDLWLKLACAVATVPVLPHVLEGVQLHHAARYSRLVLIAAIVVVTFRGVGAVRAVLFRHGLAYMLMLSSGLILACGLLLFLVEPQTVKDSFGLSVWWAVVTATTVGYGDVVPSTPGGKLIAGILMLLGVGLVSTVAASIASYFIGQSDASEYRQITHRLDRIERLLEEISGQRSEPSAPDASAATEPSAGCR